MKLLHSSLLGKVSPVLFCLSNQSYSKEPASTSSHLLILSKKHSSKTVEKFLWLKCIPLSSFWALPLQCCSPNTGELQLWLKTSTMLRDARIHCIWEPLHAASEVTSSRRSASATLTNPDTWLCTTPKTASQFTLRTPSRKQRAIGVWTTPGCMNLRYETIHSQKKKVHKAVTGVAPFWKVLICSAG